MKFEEIIRTISSWVAGVAVFLIAAGIYLSAKGFVMGPDGVPVLVKNAQAEDNTVEINKNAALPQGKILGNPKAPVAIYEFSSYGCFHCADFHLQVLPEIKKNYIDKILHRSTLYLMTSYRESFGIVLLEAMSHGLPCIAFSSIELY